MKRLLLFSLIIFSTVLHAMDPDTAAAFITVDADQERDPLLGEPFNPPTPRLPTTLFELRRTGRRGRQAFTIKGDHLSQLPIELLSEVLLKTFGSADDVQKNYPKLCLASKQFALLLHDPAFIQKLVLQVCNTPKDFAVLGKVSPLFNQVMKHQPEFLQQLAWKVCNTPQECKETGDEKLGAAFQLLPQLIDQLKQPYAAILVNILVMKLHGAAPSSKTLQVHSINDLFNCSKKELSFLLRAAACEKRCSILIPFIILAGADLESSLATDYKYLSEAGVIENDMNALHLSIEKSNISAVKQLLAAGSDINRQECEFFGDQYHYRSALFNAVLCIDNAQKSIAMLELLLEQGARLGIDCETMRIAKQKIIDIWDIKGMGYGNVRRRLLALLEKKEQEELSELEQKEQEELADQEKQKQIMVEAMRGLE